MKPGEMMIEQHLTVLYLLDVGQGEGVSEVESGEPPLDAPL
jgi:hypothetical protein